MTALGAPLVVFTDYETCDGRGHEVAIVTDGIRAYAWAEGVDLPLIARDGASPQVRVSCRVPDAGGEECHGTATFDLTDDLWTTDPSALTILATAGKAMDR